MKNANQKATHKGTAIPTSGIIILALGLLVYAFWPEPAPKMVRITAPGSQVANITSKVTASPAAPTRTLDVVSSSMLSLVNQQRMNAGLAPVIELAHLDAAANQRAISLIQSGQWSHAGYVEALDGALWNHSRRYIGENLARDYPNEQAVVNAWMNSPAHKKIMLGSQYKYAGIGHYQTYWVLWMSSNP